MRGLFNRFANFMQGRYGTDKLNNALWVLLLILWFVNIFVWNRVARYIIDGIMLLIIVLICFRCCKKCRKQKISSDLQCGNRLVQADLQENS